MTVAALDSLMTPLAECLEGPSLRALVDFRTSAKSAKRMAWLAERANEGTLSPDERSEYESAIMFANFVGILQSKARKKLAAAS